MKNRFVVALVVAVLSVAESSIAVAGSTLWNTGYYAGWMQDYLPPAEIDFSALTHVIHFAAIPNNDGSLDTSTNVLTAAYSADLVPRARAAGVKALVSIGGEGSAPGFRSASSAANRARFVANIVSLMTSRGYEGVDVDWEPLASTDATLFTALVNDLRAALNALTPRPLLTVPVAAQPALLASLQGSFDQINLMSYSLSGPWSGWVSWFNSPLYDGGYRFPSTGGLVPSTDGMLASFLAAGVAPAKLGIGVSFYGYLWNSIAAPRQGWTTAPTTYQLPYYSIMDNYSLSPFQYFWDNAAQSGYYALDQSGSSSDKFVSFDDPPALQAKIGYARAKGIGGVMIWELAGGYRATQASGNRDPLLQAMKQALGGTSSTPTPTSPLPTATPTVPAPTATPTVPAPTPTPTVVPSCTYAVSPLQQSFNWKGGNGSASISTASGCGWTAASGAAWLTITSGASGSGNGTVRYSAATNPTTSQRSATITVGGKTITVSEGAAKH